MKYIILLILVTVSCTKKEELSFKHHDILNMGVAVDKNFEFVVPPSIGISLVDCSQYTPKCIEGYRGKAKLIEFNILKFKTHKDAQKSASSFDGFYSNNWSFDHVKGEPILERFVKKAFNAKLAD